LSGSDGDEDKSMLSADYGEEGEHDMFGGGEEEGECAPEDSADESEIDAMMQGMEEDEMQRQDLKIPADLEGGLGDEEESEDEDEDEGGGLFPEDPDKTPFPDFGQEEDDEF
jgi:hypothetical protein